MMADHDFVCGIMMMLSNVADTSRALTIYVQCLSPFGKEATSNYFGDKPLTQEKILNENSLSHIL
jgi:hypothetical protein